MSEWDDLLERVKRSGEPVTPALIDRLLVEMLVEESERLRRRIRLLRWQTVGLVILTCVLVVAAILMIALPFLG